MLNILWADIRRHLSSNIDHPSLHLLVCLFSIFIWFSLSVISSSNFLSYSTCKMDRPVAILPLGPSEICPSAAGFLLSFPPHFQMFYWTYQPKGCHTIPWQQQVHWPADWIGHGRQGFQFSGLHQAGWSDRILVVFHIPVDKFVVEIGPWRQFSQDQSQKYLWSFITALIRSCFETNSHRTVYTSCSRGCSVQVYDTGNFLILEWAAVVSLVVLAGVGLPPIHTKCTNTYAHQGHCT